jgi:hypothetical protein
LLEKDELERGNSRLYLAETIQRRNGPLLNS